MVTTRLTSVTGLFFPVRRILPSYRLGVLSLMRWPVLSTGGIPVAWTAAYAISAAIALYLNVFVLVAQLFQTVPSLQALAPTQSGPPFPVTQFMVMSAVGLRGERIPPRSGARDMNHPDSGINVVKNQL